MKITKNTKIWRSTNVKNTKFGIPDLWMDVPKRTKGFLEIPLVRFYKTIHRLYIPVFGLPSALDVQIFELLFKKIYAKKCKKSSKLNFGP